MEILVQVAIKIRFPNWILNNVLEHVLLVCSQEHLPRQEIPKDNSGKQHVASTEGFTNQGSPRGVLEVLQMRLRHWEHTYHRDLWLAFSQIAHTSSFLATLLPGGSKGEFYLNTKQPSISFPGNLPSSQSDRPPLWIHLLSPTWVPATPQVTRPQKELATLSRQAMSSLVQEVVWISDFLLVITQGICYTKKYLRTTPDFACVFYLIRVPLFARLAISFSWYTA